MKARQQSKGLAMFRRIAFVSLFAASLAGQALAGDQYIDKTGFAVSGFDVVSYFDLPQVEVGQSQREPQAGKAAITADHNGATFAFSTEANRETSSATPRNMSRNMTGTAPTAWQKAERCRATRRFGGLLTANCI